MKKVFVLIFTALCSFTACNNKDTSSSSFDNRTENNKIETNEINEYSDVIFESGEYDDKRWKSDSDYDGKDCIPDKESAIQLANLIFNNHYKNIDFYKEFKFKLQKIFYDEIDNVWVAEFFPSYDELEEGTGIAGGELFIAISQKDAEVLAIWGGE